MSLLFNAYPLARAALFSLDAEKAHELTLEGLQHAYKLGLSRFMPAPPIAPRTLMGMTLRNSVGLAAGLDKNGAYIDALAACGFGFIEVGTVTPRPQPGNPRPRMFRLPQANAIINRMGFNNHGLDAFLENVQASRFRRRGGILGLNIGKNADTPIEKAVDDYVNGLTGVYLHADYVTVNIYSPNTKNLRALQGADELSQLLSRLSQAREELSQTHSRRVPIVVKIAPDLDEAQVDVIAELLPSFGIDGVIATNTTLDRSAVLGMEHADEAGGLSGPPAQAGSLRVISRLRARAGESLAIIGVGGIQNGADAQAKIAAGADVVQLYTGLIYRGPALIRECSDAIGLGRVSPAATVQTAG